jgi:hypothetical protein
MHILLVPPLQLAHLIEIVPSRGRTVAEPPRTGELKNSI